MAKNHSYRKATRKSMIAALCALSVTCTAVAAACTPQEEKKDPAKPAKEDTHLLKNGSFEYFTIPDDAIYLIKNVSDWTLGGDGSVKSGIIGTSPKDWEALTDEGLEQKLEYNNDVGSSSDEYIDYNSMRSRDILYKEPYAATRTADQVKNDNLIDNFGGLQKFLGIEGNDADGYTLDGVKVYRSEDDKDFFFDEEFTKPVRKAVIDNPETHLGKFEEKSGEWYLGDQKLYEGDDGALYSDEAKENTVGNVLMVHNYTTDGKYNGIRQYYTSNTITLEANTAAEISVWVKTSDLKFDKGYTALSEQDKGATIEVIQTVNGTDIDSFVVKNINTEKIISGAASDKDNKPTTEQNGWLNYKIYVNACDFAESTIQLRLGLGRENEEQVTGYAFFDDVTVTKFRTLDDKDCTYSQNKDKVVNCSLTSDKDEKIFNADKELRETGGTDLRHAYDFHYAIDLASTTGSSDNSYSPVILNSDSVTAFLTTEKDGLKLYASSAMNEANFKGVAHGDRTGDYDLVKNFNGRPTKNDLLGTFSSNTSFTADLFDGIDYSSVLNDALRGDNALPDYDGNTLVMLSSWGAAYTSTISSDNFKVKAESYAIASFWIKTSDMNGKTAATIKVYDADDKDDSTSLTIDTTGVAYAFENQKDIYKGWVPCFVFVENDSDTDKQFAIDFSFGNTTIKSATYEGGWVALANLQTLTVDEEIYKLATSGNYTALYSFKTEDDDDDGKVMDDALGTSDIKSDIAIPSNYNGLNGANSSFTDNDNRQSYDASNTNPLAGLINRDYIGNYSNSTQILTSFNSAATNWDEAFGADCYQPLIIINNLRRYAEEESGATADTVTDYYVEDENGTIVTPSGKKYSKATEYDEDTKYYSLKEVVNYGFVGANKTISSDSYETISVKVMVSGDAEAYIYLVNSDEPQNLLSYTTPSYTFYYDNEGNVLDAEFDKDWKESEHRDHIIYTLRDDGLYARENKVYANLYNLKKSFKNYKFEHETFYNEDGQAVSFDNLVEGENYYTTADKTTLASHYLVATDGTRVYEFKNGAYYYIVDNVTSDTKVENFDQAYARYDEALNEQFFVKVTNTEGKWVTVNFFVHSGSAAKNYRLEMWSGSRTETGVKTNGSTSVVEKNGAVAFDTSSYSLSSSNYATVLGEYENNVIYAYQEVLGDKLGADAYGKNIAYYENLVNDGTITEAQIKSVLDRYGIEYKAKYYAYTLYDSEAYIPFNSTTAEDGETGYDYNADDFNELLAYFEYNDKAQNSRNVFVDYSAVDQNISINRNTPDDDDDDEETTTNGDVWLYVSSIVLVVVLLITLAAILIRDYLKKRRIKKGTKQRSKNVYRQRDRYIKKLHLVKNEEAEETVEPVTEPDEVEPEAEPAEETVTEEPLPADDNAEEPVEETEQSDGDEKTE